MPVLQAPPELEYTVVSGLEAGQQYSIDGLTGEFKMLATSKDVLPEGSYTVTWQATVTA